MIIIVPVRCWRLSLSFFSVFPSGNMDELNFLFNEHNFDLTQDERNKLNRHFCKEYN